MHFEVIEIPLEEKAQANDAGGHAAKDKQTNPNFQHLRGL